MNLAESNILQLFFIFVLFLNICPTTSLKGMMSANITLFNIRIKSKYDCWIVSILRVSTDNIQPEFACSACTGVNMLQYFVTIIM